MGQSASTPRDQDRPDNDTRIFSRLRQSPQSEINPSLRQEQPASSHPPVSAAHIPPDAHAQATQSFATFSRQISASSIPVARGGSVRRGNTARRDAIFYEQQEERPLVHMEELGMRNAPITHITASPMPRQSRLSRLSSMIIPRNPDNVQNHGRLEGQSHRRRSLHRDPLEVAREGQRNRHRPLSLFGTSSPDVSVDAGASRRSMAPISRPIPLTAETILPPSFFAVSPRRTSSQQGNLAPSQIGATQPFNRTPSSGSRFARFRRSLSVPFDALPTTHHTSANDRGTQMPPQRPARDSLPDSSYVALPPLGPADSNIDFTSSSPGPDRPTSQEQRLSDTRTLSQSPERINRRASGPGWTDRWVDRSPMGRRESRRGSSMLGGRSTRLVRRDHDGPLPRILSLAAMAIAAQLTGSIEQTAGDLQAIGPDDLDGSLQSLFRTLQSTMHRAVGEPTVGENGHEPGRPTGSPTPLNYLRVFRYVSHTTSTAGQAESSTRETANGPSRINDQPARTEGSSEDAEGRTVTLVVVGVRSVLTEDVLHEDEPTTDSGLDSLLEMPPLTPSSNFLGGGAGGLLRHANGRSRFAHRRRASSGGITPFPANYDSQRHQRTLSASRPPSADARPASGSATPSAAPPHVLSESPPGPHPPPSTPADPGLSAYSSQVTTPSRRPSSASAIQQPQIPIRDVATQHLREAAVPITEDQSTRRVQQRRRSDSEFARHRDLGAGAARRNGVVAPDDTDAATPSASASRSWLIYVVGTNLSEDHPALTAPSLFTDVSHSDEIINFD